MLYFLGGKMYIVSYIRITLTLLLLYGVYEETGIWTTITLFLIFVTSEIEAYLKRNITIKSTLTEKAGSFK